MTQQNTDTPIASTMTDALRIIIKESQTAAADALKCIRAIQVNSPVVQSRYNNVIAHAFADTEAKFSRDDRAFISSFVFAPGDSAESRGEVVRVRITATQSAELTEAAERAGMTLSDYMRKKLGL